ncbi:MAG: hypothetical protein V1874_05905 [Spirochaetota bacterium]
MKKILLYIISACILTSSQLSAQNLQSIEFINNVADKDKALYADGINFFMLVTGKKIQSFEENIRVLNREGITTGITLTKNSPLRRGALALMLARYLRLGDSLFYKIFGTERYAYRACAANKLMSYDGSEWETLSGGELIEIMTNVSELTGGNE